MQKITAEELNHKLQTDRTIVLDVRAKEKYESNPLKHKNIDNLHIPKTEIFNFADQDHDTTWDLPKNKEIIVTCTTGNSASKCVNILSEKGYQVTLLEGGITSWEAQQKEKKAD